MSYFEIRRKQKIEEQLSDAIAEEEAISDITAESQQTSQIDNPDQSNDLRDHDEQIIESDPSLEENTEDKPA